MIKHMLMLAIVAGLVISGCSHDTAQYDNQSDPGVTNLSDSLDTADTIIRKGILVDQGQSEFSVVLYEDDGIRLRIGDSHILVKPEDSIQQQDRYSMQITHSMVVIANRYVTSRGQGIEYQFYTYADQHIRQVYSSADMVCRIVDLDRGEVSISLAYGDTTIRYPLSDAEREQTSDRISELEENGIAIDEELMAEIADNISCEPIEMVIDDVNKDGYEDILVLTNLRSLGAKTPLRMNTNSVFLFEMKDAAIQYARIEFRQDELSEDGLFTYFPHTLVDEK